MQATSFVSHRAPLGQISGSFTETYPVVRTLTDRAKSVCSSPELLTEEMEHLGVLGSVQQNNNDEQWNPLVYFYLFYLQYVQRLHHELN